MCKARNTSENKEKNKKKKIFILRRQAVSEVEPVSQGHGQAAGRAAQRQPQHPRGSHSTACTKGEAAPLLLVQPHFKTMPQTGVQQSHLGIFPKILLQKVYSEVF